MKGSAFPVASAVRPEGMTRVATDDAASERSARHVTEVARLGQALERHSGQSVDHAAHAAGRRRVAGVVGAEIGE